MLVISGKTLIFCRFGVRLGWFWHRGSVRLQLRVEVEAHAQVTGYLVSGFLINSLSWRATVARRSSSFTRRSSIVLETAELFLVSISGRPVNLFTVFCTSILFVINFMMRSLVPSTLVEVGWEHYREVSILCCEDLCSLHSRDFARLSPLWFVLAHHWTSGFHQGSG